MFFLLYFHGNIGCMKAPHYFVIRTLVVLLLDGTYATRRLLLFFFSLALQPSAGYGLLVDEVS
jgi:hypothetical protein